MCSQFLIPILLFCFILIPILFQFLLLSSISFQTGNEASVDRLMKQISSFMSEISDEFKTVVVEAIKSVCVKFPRKHHVLMNFLSNMLREEVSSTGDNTV